MLYIKNIKYYKINMLKMYNKSLNNFSNIIMKSLSKKVKLTFTTRDFKTSSLISQKPLIKKKFPSPHDLGIHHIFKHFRPIINPLVNTFSKNRLEKAVNIADLRICAKKRSHKMVFDYLDSGADDEIILKRANDAYSDLEMHYKCLSGLKPPLDLSTKILEKMSVSLFLVVQQQEIVCFIQKVKLLQQRLLNFTERCTLYHHSLQLVLLI